MLTIKQTEPPSMAVVLNGDLELNLSANDSLKAKVIFSLENYHYSLPPNLDPDGKDREFVIILDLRDFPSYPYMSGLLKEAYPYRHENQLGLAYVKVGYGTVCIRDSDIEISLPYQVV